MIKGNTSSKLATLEKKFRKKKKEFEEAYSGGQHYEEVNALYHELKALQNELNSRITEADTKESP